MVAGTNYDANTNNDNERAFCQSLAAFATKTYRANSEATQDAGVVLRLPTATLIAICDGMGSFAHAGEAARFCLDTLAKRVAPQMTDWGNKRHLMQLFAWLRSELQRYAAWRNRNSGASDTEGSYGTTLLLASESKQQLNLSYVGNGAIFRLPGNFWEFPEEMALPWCWVNLLNPHTRQEQGREALYRYLSPDSTDPMVTPTTLNFSKDDYFGDLLVVKTDGIFSADQVTQGLANGALWQEVECRIIALHRALRRFFAEAAQPTQAGLEQALTAYLDDLKARDLLDDDATLGVLITNSALAYHAKGHALQKEAL